MSSCRATNAKPRKSGRNLPEAERGTVAVKLRLPEDVADAVRARGEDDPKGASGYVTRLVREDGR